jgi:DNA-binding transcriptional ArsR family regulator
MHASPALFQALGDPTRLQLVELLRAGELPVNDLAARAGRHQSGVSRHLRVLAHAGVVSARVAGPQRFYALRAEPFEALEAWAHAYRAMWEARLDRFGAALAKPSRKRARGAS